MRHRTARNRLTPAATTRAEWRSQCSRMASASCGLRRCNGRNCSNVIEWCQPAAVRLTDSVKEDARVKRYERLNTLLESLAEKGAIDVDELAEQLHVSAATIRRDLDHLGKQQLLTRTRGGAVANAVSYDLPLRYKTARFASEKQRIAQAAATLVRRGMVI